MLYVGQLHRVMNGINAPKVVECMGSDGCIYKQLAKSGNDDLRQDAVKFSYASLFSLLASKSFKISRK